VFEEGKAWNWDAAYTEGAEFSVEEIAEPDLSALGYGVGNTANLDDHQHDDSGGAVDSADSDDHQMSDHGEPSDHTQHVDNEMENSVDNGTGTLSGTVAGQATDAESSEVAGAGHGNDVMDLDDTVDQDDGPVRFRNLNEVYEDLVEVELIPDTEVDALLAMMEEPANFRDAAGDENWVAAMDSEIQSINRNKTWELAQLPVGHKPIGLKWVYKLKRNADGNVVKHKARLVAKGYVQQQGIDFEEVFAPVARLDTVRLLLSMAANLGWQVHHLDVKTAFSEW
jgi:hypothetical protein